jgi:hypothetical protein
MDLMDGPRDAENSVPGRGRIRPKQIAELVSLHLRSTRRPDKIAEPIAFLARRV